MTETEENQLLVDAETRRREKAARTTPSEPEMPRDTLEAAMDRLQALTTAGSVLMRPPGEQIVAASRAKELRTAASIPERHDKAITPTDSLWQRTHDKIALKLKSGFLIALTGIQGTGKTQMGASLIYSAADRLMSCKYACAMDFFIELKATFQDDAESRESAVINRYLKPKFLVLDEMDERSGSDWENRLLFHMLNKRYNAMVDTLLISRSNRSDFLASIGASVQSRMQETGAIITCDWPSWRGR